MKSLDNVLKMKPEILENVSIISGIIDVGLKNVNLTVLVNLKDSVLCILSEFLCVGSIEEENMIE